MPTTGTFEYDYDFDVESVAELLLDADFLRMRCEAAGDKNIEIDRRETSDGIHLTIARSRTLDLPKIVQGLVSSTNRAVENTVWRRSGERWVADYSVEVAGLPGKVSGRTTLIPTSNGCHYESSFQVSAKVPLFARKVESAIADGFVEQLTNMAQRNASALSERPPSMKPPAR